MSTSPLPTEGPVEPTVQIVQTNSQPRDASYWSRQVSELKVLNVPSGALNLNVDGKQVVGPLQGFGKMWQKPIVSR